MEKIVRLHLEKLPEGYYRATSADVQGLIAQGRTITETLEIARDVARKLLEAQQQVESISDDVGQISELDYPLIVAL